MRRLRIALVGPVATTIPAPKSGSVELVTALLCEGLTSRGHEVTLFGVDGSTAQARLHGSFERGYLDDPVGMWPWEMCELFNVAEACERHDQFDLIHYQAAYFPMVMAFSRLVPIPIVQTIHHQPVLGQLRLFHRYPDTHYVALSGYQAQALTGLPHVTTIPHGLDVGRFPFSAQAGDYLVFLGRFTHGKGALQAIEVAKRAGVRLFMAAAPTDYYREHIAPRVDGDRVQYLGELDFAAKTQLLRGARALLYPVQEAEPFGLVLVEAMACGTPIAALRSGAVPELVADGVSGYAFEGLDALVQGLPNVYALDRRAVRAHAERHFDASRMVVAHERLYASLVGS